MQLPDNLILWTARKLATQPPTYLPKRLWGVSKKRWVDRYFPTSRMRRQAQLEIPSNTRRQGLRAHIAFRHADRWYWTESQTQEIVRTIPLHKREATIQKASALARGEFVFRGKAARVLGRGQWHAIDLPIGWTWDLNRHHWFSTLGFAYAYTGDERFIAAFLDRSADWIQCHLPGLGRIGWDTPFEVASRINAWLWAHYLFLHSTAWPEQHYQSFVDALGLQAEYLSWTLEHHCPGNHILLEAKALAMIGEAFPEFRGSARWRKLAWEALDAELVAQVCSDGVHAERSTMYHKIIAGELAELLVHCRRNDVKKAARLEVIVAKMADFQGWIDQGHGNLPLFGDAHSNDTYYRFAAHAVAGSTPVAPEKILASEPVDYTYWLSHSFPCIRSIHDELVSQPSGRAFQKGGYYIARSGWSDDSDVLVWDCGPAGYEINRKHAHLDCLSFTLSLGGMPILIDPGVHETAKFKLPLRSTFAHNTVTIDGEEQGQLASRGEIWSPPRATIEKWASSSRCTFMIGSHDGYYRKRAATSVMRTIVAMHGKYWVIVDSIAGTGHRCMEQRLHVVPGASVSTESVSKSARVTNHGQQLVLKWVPPCMPGQERKRGDDLSLVVDSGWAELECGVAREIRVLRAVMRGDLPFDSAFIAVPNTDDVIVSRAKDMFQQSWLVVCGSGYQDRVLAGSAAKGNIRLPGGWETDSPVVVLHEKEADRTGEILLPVDVQIWKSGSGESRLMEGAEQQSQVQSIRYYREKGPSTEIRS